MTKTVAMIVIAVKKPSQKIRCKFLFIRFYYNFRRRIESFNLFKSHFKLQNNFC